MIRSLVIILALALRAVAADLPAAVSPQPGRELGTGTGASSSWTTVDAGHFLAEIRQEERWDGRDGKLGERGPYQFREITWRQHMQGTAFAQARQEGPAHACAVKHLAWLRRELKAAGADDNAFNLALCWNAGLQTVLQGRAPERAYQYATRVSQRYRGLTVGKDKPTQQQSTQRRLTTKPATPHDAILSGAARLQAHSGDFGRWSQRSRSGYEQSGSPRRYQARPSAVRATAQRSSFRTLGSQPLALNRNY